MKRNRYYVSSNCLSSSISVISAFSNIESVITMSVATSFEVFMKYIEVKKDGTVEVNKVFTHDCLNEWVRTRKIPPKQPVESYRRTLTAHVKGADQRRPFPPEIEKAMLAKLRTKRVWDGFEGIGRYGFRGQGFHEKKGVLSLIDPVGITHCSGTLEIVKAEADKRKFPKPSKLSHHPEVRKFSEVIDEQTSENSENSSGSSPWKKAHVVEEAIAEINRFDGKLNNMYQRVVIHDSSGSCSSIFDFGCEMMPGQTNADSEFFRDLALMHESGIDQTEIKLIFKLAQKCKEESERMISTFWLAKIILSIQYLHTDALESKLLDLCFERTKRLNALCYSLNTPALFENFDVGKQDFVEFCNTNRNFFVPAGVDIYLGKVAIGLNLKNFSIHQRDLRQFIISHAYVLQFQSATVAEMRKGGIHVINARNLSSDQFSRLVNIFHAAAGTFFDPAYCQNCFQVICLVDNFARSKMKDLLRFWPKEMTRSMVFAGTIEDACIKCGLNLDFSQLHESLGGFSEESIEEFVEKRKQAIIKTEGRILEAVNALGKLPVPN